MSAPFSPTTFDPFVLSFFCGSGGMAYGFKQAGFRGAGIDYDPRACDDYQRLTGEPAHRLDLAKVTVAELLELFPECPDVAATSSPCLPADGIVMMEDGPRRIDSVMPGQLVLTHTGRLCTVDKVNVRPYQGRMHGLRLNGTIDTDIQWYTDEHPIWIRKVRRGTDKVRTLRAPQWTPARDVEVNDRVGFPVPKEVPGTAEAFVGQFGDPTILHRGGVFKGASCVSSRLGDLRGFARSPALWRLLGMYIGDGDRRNKGGYTVRFSVGPRGGVAYRTAVECLETLGLSYHVQGDDDRNVRIGCAVRHLWQLCGPFGTSSHMKCIPEALMGLEAEFLDALIHGLRVTDGNARAKYGNPDYGWAIGSVSLPLLRSVQRVMLRTGRFGCISRLARAGRMLIEGREVNISDSYTLAFINKPKWTCCKFEDGMVWLRVKKVYQRDTIEPVWNLEVNDDHTFCSPLIATHNCVGLSGCMSEEKAATEKYQAFNALTLRGIELMVEAWKHSPASRRKQPGLIVFENVPRITSRGKVFLDKIVALLQREGYSVHMSSHCCGELAEGLAEKRPRFLLVARHMETVPDYLRKPRKNKPLALREVLCELPPPRPDTKGMHRLPDLSDLNKLRLACIPAGGDWRNLPPEVLLYHCESHELEAVTGIRWVETKGRQTGKLGVLSWEAPARTVIGNSRVCQTWAAVADPRVAWSTTGKFKDRPHHYGVADDRQPSATIRGMQTLQNTRASLVDPRLGVHVQIRQGSESTPRNGNYGVVEPEQPGPTIRGESQVWCSPTAIPDPRLVVRTSTSDHNKNRQNGGYGVDSFDEPRGTVVGEAGVQNARASVVDPRLSCAQRATSYGVNSDAEPAGTVVGSHSHDNSAGSVVDPRLGHKPRNDSYGVQDAAEPSSVVRGEHSARQAPGAVDDPRLGKRRARKAKPPKDYGIRYDERGWPIPTHELVRLDDGRFVLYGPPRDFTRKRPVPGMVIRSYDGTLHRPLTTRELARIQGFPNWFEFCGPASCGDDLPDGTPQTGQRKRIGNAVPPPAAYAIARECYDTLLASASGGLRLSSGMIWVEREERLSA